MRARSSAEVMPVNELDAHGCPVLPGLRVVRRNGVRLVEQICRGIEALVEQGRLRAGTRVPSVRDLSRALGVSTFTVVEAYEMLVARRLFSARRGSGYFVLHRPSTPRAPEPPRAPAPASIGDTWLTIQLFAQHRNLVAAGCGWLPAEWCGESSITEALRQAARIPNERLAGYGAPLGFLPLRQHLAERLSEKLAPVSPDQLVLTHGASHALDLVVKTLLQPGDAVLVESPGYCNLFPMLRERGCRLLPVPRTKRGLCLDTLHLLAADHRPKAMFVHTALQNPLSTSLSQLDAYRLLAAAERFDFTVVEDDIFRDFCTTAEPSLAAMDGLKKRVLNLGSFSKAISPSLRVGYVAAPEALVDRLLRTKMVSGLTTSEVNERIVHEVVSNPSHRRYLERLRSRLAAARERLLATLDSLGLEPLAVPEGGMFVSAGWRAAPTPTVNARAIADAALKERIALAPGEFFEVGGPQSIWFRFNVAYSDDPRLHAFLREIPGRFGLSSVHGS
jgi:DNA-binding transcriptional MocR family regulator